MAEDTTKEDQWPLGRTLLPRPQAREGKDLEAGVPVPAEAGSTAQTLIVLSTPLLSFPRRWADGNWGGLRYPEISSFYELPHLARRGTWPIGRNDGHPLPASSLRFKLFPAQTGG